eukprot:1206354-Pyramimonas_sp.AAC.1
MANLRAPPQGAVLRPLPDLPLRMSLPRARAATGAARAWAPFWALSFLRAFGERCRDLLWFKLTRDRPRSRSIRTWPS